MASPFDFSAFLLTPPIPNYSNNYSTSASDNNNQQQQRGNSSSSNNIGGNNSGGDLSAYGNINNNNNNNNLGGQNSTTSTSLSASAPSSSGYGAFNPAYHNQQNPIEPQRPQYQDYRQPQQQQQQQSNDSYHQQPQQQQQGQGQGQQQRQQPQHFGQLQQPQQPTQYANTFYNDQNNNNNGTYGSSTLDNSHAFRSFDISTSSGNGGGGGNNGSQNYSTSVSNNTATSSSTAAGGSRAYNELPPIASGSSGLQHTMTAGKMIMPTTTTNLSLDERDYGLDPSAFSSVSFQMPSFLSASTQANEYGNSNSTAPAAVDPSAFLQNNNNNSSSSMPSSSAAVYQSSFFSAPPAALQAPPPPSSSSSLAPRAAFQQHMTETADAASNATAAVARRQSTTNTANNNNSRIYKPDPKNPVYGIYGSSVISVNPDPSPFKMALKSATQPVANPIYNNNSTAESDRSASPDFDPKSLGLPVGNQLFPQPLPGLYSSSGFDMLGVLARVVARTNPQINIGPVDTSCSFLVVDARRYDMPIVFASDTFTKLTGYQNAEIIGRNCRFLQSPDGSVPMGSKRKYTDPNAVYHLKTHIQSGKETQASIINYRKDGSPFINLVTVVPISWDTDEIAYFVGFQVDLVEQPNAILEKMRNGTYVVNYSLLPTNPAPLQPELPAPASSSAGKSVVQDDYNTPIIPEEPVFTGPKTIRVGNPLVASGAATAAAAQSSMTIAPELLEVMGAISTGDEVDDDASKKRWNKMLLDHTGDFVHVLSLKGSFLYVSPSVTSMLEYDPSDLVGKTLQSVCHPSDIVPVMRELKDNSNTTTNVINLLYRFRRKHSGYIWLEAQGKLYLEQSKSRKCVILVGRERPVYNLSWQDLRDAGGLGEKEYWSKITTNGMFLYNTPTVKTVLGYDAAQLQGKSMFDFMDVSRAPDFVIALNDARAGKSVRLRYKLRNAQGKFVDVITNFFPNTTLSTPGQGKLPTSGHPSIVLQTNEYASEMRRRATMRSGASRSLPVPDGLSSPADQEMRHKRPGFLRAPSAIRDMIVTTPDASDDGESAGSRSNSGGSGSGSDSSAPSTFSAIPSTYKTLLSQAKAESDNLFDELDTTRTTSWQYELHQLKLTNKKLKEELSTLLAAKRKRKKREEMGQAGPGGAMSAASPQNSGGSQSTTKTCANCGKTDSPEWRVGPSGSRNLCNACGLRWAKATRGQRQSSGTPSGGSGSSSANSDMENASSYLQPVGPFALQRPGFQHSESSRFN